MTADPSRLRRVAGMLAANRTLVYLGGLACIGGVTLAENRLPVVDDTLRIGVVGAVLAVMVVTYLAELWQHRATADEPPVTTRARVVALFGLVGIVAGIALVGTGREVGGLLFFVGGLAVFQHAASSHGGRSQ